MLSDDPCGAGASVRVVDGVWLIGATWTGLFADRDDGVS